MTDDGQATRATFASPVCQEFLPWVDIESLPVFS
jgi:hypothetical protein